MIHLTSEELVEAVEDTLATERRAHLNGCARCREQFAELARLLTEVRAVDVPEPSPLFWDRLSDNVRRTIAAEGPSPPRVARWFEWPVLVPVGALAVLVFALVSAVPQSDDVRGDQMALVIGTNAIETDMSADADAHWELMAALIGDVDLDTAEQAGMTTAPGTADEVVFQLTSAEQEELVRLLREELKGSGG